MNQDLFKKIKGLLALSQNSTNAGESAAAAYAAQKLLEKHKLNLAEIELLTGAKQISEEILNCMTPLYSGKRIVAWKSDLAAVLAKFNSCKMYVGNEIDRIEFRLIGRQSDIDIVRYMFCSIASQIEAASDQALHKGKGAGKTFTNNFKHAAMREVLRRLDEARNEARKKASTNAIVLVDNRMKEVEDWQQKNYSLKKGRPRVQTRRDTNGVLQGIIAGRNVSLNKGLGGNSDFVKMFGN